MVELETISSEFKEHPAVLEMRWQAYAGQSNWDAGREIAEALVKQIPDEPAGWLHLAYATRRARDGGVRAAWDVLLPAAEKFPRVPLISYNLACYACQLGLLDLARDWLRKAFAIDSGRYKAMALKDSDLEPLWTEIGQM